MRKIVSTLVSAAFVASLALPVAVSISAPAHAISKQNYCDKKARKYANKKTNQKVFTNMLIGGVAGGLLGSALGGKKATVFGAAGGAATGMVVGGSQWERYYWNRFEDCMED